MSEKIFDRELIFKVAANGATGAELDTLIHLATSYDLDPLKKEIYFLKMGGRASILTSRDGLLAIANRDPQFDGLESDVVYHGDTITKREDGSLLIEYGEAHLVFDRTKLTGAFCNIFRKDRSKPTSVFVAMKDYDKGAGIWKQYPNAMILKVAESMALKRAFALSGLTSQEEVDKNNEEEEITTTKNITPTDPNQSERPISSDQLEEIQLELIGHSDLTEVILKKLHLSNLSDMQRGSYRSVMNYIKEAKSKKISDTKPI